MRLLLLLDEEHCHLGLGCDFDPPSESNLCRVHRVHHRLLDRTSIITNHRYVGGCVRCAGGGLFVKIAVGLLVVVHRLYLSWSARVLLRLAPLFVLAHGRLLLGDDSAAFSYTISGC